MIMCKMQPTKWKTTNRIRKAFPTRRRTTLTLTCSIWAHVFWLGNASVAHFATPFRFGKNQIYIVITTIRKLGNTYIWTIEGAVVDDYICRQSLEPVFKIVQSQQSMPVIIYRNVFIIVYILWRHIYKLNNIHVIDIRAFDQLTTTHDDARWSHPCRRSMWWHFFERQVRNALEPSRHRVALDHRYRSSCSIWSMGPEMFFDWATNLNKYGLMERERGGLESSNRWVDIARN